ncbi:uncharacterized protein LOC131882917 isoform X2 [Tigriopus californicus]|uniref:uncharacterized protein LOC131882917 isoform X2 n=1 Tax=Tigriopus californicus TaxID=6832 RepID=UPI0027DA944E|nr:uncharacterized protein LOC131882917 isoform X2 [Tigriopus californicus]
MAQALRLVLLTGFVLAFHCIGASDSMETHEEEKRFKTSPFTWSNPLSGYNIVLVRVPNHSPQEDKYQLQGRFLMECSSLIFQ